MRHIGIARVQGERPPKTVFGQRHFIKAHINQPAQVVGFRKCRVGCQRLLDLIKRDFGLALFKIAGGQFDPQSGTAAQVGFVGIGYQISAVSR